MTGDRPTYDVYSALDVIALLASESFEPDNPLTINWCGTALHYPEGMSPRQYEKLINFAQLQRFATFGVH